MTDDDHEGMWIRTEPSLDGLSYVTTLTIDQDYAVTLTPARALGYAETLLGAVAEAEYDAAILQQLTSKPLGIDVDVAGQLIVDMRGERPAREAAGLVFVPGVSQRAQHPFVQIMRDGTQIGQFDAPAARRHAMHVLEAPTAADLDAAYLRVLRGMVGLDENTAREVVEDIGNHRADWAVSDQ